MANISELEKKIYELTRAHINNEHKILSYQNNSKVVPIDDDILTKLIIDNYRGESKIQALCSEFFGPMQVHDPQVREQLIRIRSHTTETARFFNEHTGGLLTHENLKLILEGDKFKDILSNWEEQTLDDMIEYLTSAAGYSVDFENRKKEFGTIFIQKSAPPNLKIFLRLTKDFFLLRMHAAVIGFSRLLLEIACVHIYDRLPERDKMKNVDIERDVRVVQKIIRACDCRLRDMNVQRKEIDKFREKAVAKYKEASEILHGKLPEPKTEEESLAFVRDVFSIIEALY